jgi:hypothetical protein
MHLIGTYFGRHVFWLDYDQFPTQLPDKDWLCLAIANHPPDLNAFDTFVRTSIARTILEFKGHGRFGERLHDVFNETVVSMELYEHHSDIRVMTTWHTNEPLVHTFWQCFFATCLPETADLDNIKIVCTDLDGVNRSDELKNYLVKFESGWLP